MGLVVTNRGVLVLLSFSLLGNIDLSVCTFSFMLWESLSGDRCMFSIQEKRSYFKLFEKALYGIHMYEDTY